MQYSTQAVNTALRVLTAITEKRNPPDDEIRALERFAGAKPEAMDWDDYACKIVREGINQLSEAHGALGPFRSLRAS